MPNPLLNYLDPDDEDSLRPDDEEEGRYLNPHALASASGLPNAPAYAGGNAGGDDSNYVGDEDIESVASPAMAAGGGGGSPAAIAPAPAPARQPGLDSTAYGEAAQRVADIQARKPPVPQPKWWQRLAAAGVGAVAGLSNSEGKRGPQIDPTAAEQNILAPGYQRRISDWQNNLESAKAQLGAEQQKLNTLEQIQRINTQTQNSLVEVDPDVAMALRVRPDADGRYMVPARTLSAYLRQQGQPQYRVDPKTGTMYNLRTGEMTQPPPLPKSLTDRIREYVDAGYSKEQAQIMAAGGHPADWVKQEAPHEPNPTQVSLAVKAAAGDPGAAKALKLLKEAKPVNPLVDMMRQQRMDEMQRTGDKAIEDSKQSENDRLLKARDAEVQKALNDGGYASISDLQANLNDQSQVVKDNARNKMGLIRSINQKYAPRLQAVQDRYASSVRKRYGQDAARDYTVDPDTLSYAPRQAGAPAPQPRDVGNSGTAGSAGTAAPPKAIIDALPPGVHKFRNGQTWRKNADGTITRIS